MTLRPTIPLSLPSPRATAVTLCVFLIGAAAAAAPSLAGPFSPVPSAAAKAAAAPYSVERVGHRKWRRGGIGIVIEPGYGYGYDDYPRYRSYDYDDYGYYDDDDYRPYRRHSRKWVRERFEHPLGRR